MDSTSAPTLVHYLPIFTTLISAVFAAVVFGRYRSRGGGNHLLWWAGGIVVYGAGTFAEGWITLFGWGPVVFKFWYVVGALLGGAPLAQGTVWLLLKPATARRLTIALVSVVAIASTFVVMSPIDYTVVDPNLPSGRAFAWQWVRLFSPFINTYAVIFLVGGAIVSAWRFYKASRGGGSPIAADRFVGNVLIAAGAILPGFGGIASRAGRTEILYIMELIGIMLIWGGYWFNVRKRPLRAASNTAVRAIVSVSVVASLLWVLPAAAVALPAPTAGQAGEAAGAQQTPVVVRVAEPDGIALPRVTVVLRSLADDSTRRSLTNREGEARFEALPPGRYAMHVVKAGFTPLEEQIDVGAGPREPLELTLQFAPVTEQITVAATRNPREALRVPEEVSVIERSAIEQLQARSFDDLLRYEPGVEMAEAPRRLGQTINIRGFDDERVLVLRDGARVSQYASGHRGNLFFDIEDVETVEVVRGPASALYGSGALGGVVSVRTLDPGELLGVGQSVGAQLRSSYSSAYNEWMITPRAFGQTSGGIGWLIGYTGRQNDGTVKLADADLRLSDAEENVHDVNARLVLPASDNDLFRVSFSSYTNRGRTSTNLGDLEVSPAGLIDRSTRQFTASTNFTHTGDRWWDEDIQASVYYTDVQIDEDRISDGRIDDIGYRTVGFDARNTARIGDLQNITYGAELVDDRQSATRAGEAHAFFPDGRQRLTGLYVQDELTLASGRVAIVPGVRWDRWVSEPVDEDIEGQNVNGFTPKLGGTWEFAPGLVFATSYSEGFRAPRFRETFLSGVHFAFPLPGNRFFLALFTANPELLPEESRNVDVGLRYRRGNLSARATYWRASVSNFIELLPVFTSPFPPPGETQVEIWRADNVTDATLEGVETSLSWQVRPGLAARGSYSQGRGNNDVSGEPLLNTPAKKLVAGIDWTRFDLGTRLGLAARVYGARRDVPALVEPTDGYMLLDANFSWTPGFAPRFTGHLGVNNLTGQDYTVALFSTPGPGRDFRLGVTINLGR